MRLILIFIIINLIGYSNILGQPYQVKWKDLTGVTDNNGVLNKTSQIGAWDSGANSYNVLPAKTDGWIEFTIDNITSINIIGFSTSSFNFNYNSISYGWYINNKQGSFMESANYSDLSICQLGDVMRLSREGDQLKYYQNGIVKRSVPISRDIPLRVKGLIHIGTTPIVHSSFDVQLSLANIITPVLNDGTGGAISVTASGGTAPYSYQWKSGEATANISNKGIGYFTVTVTDALNHTGSNTYFIGYPAQVIYVKKGASGTGDGTSWINAYADLQQALIATSAIVGHKQIWVAQGEYKPTNTIDKSVSFVLPVNTFLFGGFQGNETVLDARDWKNNRTILSGDLGLLFDKNDNSYHVMTIKDTDQNSGIDGFILTQGNANGTSISHNDSGGGMLVVGSSGSTAPKIRDCEFVNNNANEYGGGMANISDGGSVSPDVTDCFFNGNTADTGGGVCNHLNAGSKITSFLNCSFSSNSAKDVGGAIANISAGAIITSCKFSLNQGLNSGGGIYNIYCDAQITGNVLWKNFKGAYGASLNYNQISSSQYSSVVVKNNLIQGGYGQPTDQNFSADPLFTREPSFVGKFPRTSVIPIQNTDPKYENVVNFSGPKLPLIWTYYTYFDHDYNKIYISGENIQTLDFNNLIQGAPTSRLYPEVQWGRIQHLEKSVHQTGNKIYIASTTSGLSSIDRITGLIDVLNPLVGEAVTYDFYKAQDVVVDNKNDLLYSPIFYQPGEVFYGLLELNLNTNAKRWINTTSNPISIPAVNTEGDWTYWDGHRLYLDELSNTLYYSTGYGIWWWNRTNNTTGVFNVDGGIPVLAGNPNLPSNLTTNMFIDHTENKFYIGTHKGLFVWDRTNNTSKVYDKDNSLMIDNLVDHIDKNEDEHLIYVACENGGLFTINTQSGLQKLIVKDLGNEGYPQLIDTKISSSYFDKTDKKLYVSAWYPNGGVWIKDYNNLIPDFGDLTQPDCLKDSLDFQVEKLDGAYSFSLIKSKVDKRCNISYAWNFADGTTSSEQNPLHTFSLNKDYLVKLQMSYQCASCPPTTLTVEHTVSNNLCDNVHCTPNGGVSIGTEREANGYKLAVNGKMIIEGAQIALQLKWPDYVFNKNYKTSSLPNLKKYIKANGHLPNMPSAKIVKNEGFEVGEMSVLLLQNIEELTLHLIQLDDRLRKVELQPNLKIK